MAHEFEVWVKFIKNDEAVSSQIYTSYDSFEDCWDRIANKAKSMMENNPGDIVRYEYLHSAVSYREEEI